MENSTDPAFEMWLNGLTEIGYDRDWCRRNIATLRKRFDQGVNMQPCPPPPAPRARDRYEEI